MMERRRPAAALALLMCLAPAAAPAGTLKAEYSVSIRGLPVGTARLKAEDGEGKYAIALSARVSGLARFFSDADMSAHVTGSLGSERPMPEGYEHVWVEDGETETVAMRFAGTAVTDIMLDPPRRRPERYVPVTEADKADVLDPISAFLWPAPNGPTPDVCARTLPLTDGKYRFDIDLSFARADHFSARGEDVVRPALVCGMRYRPISGHRIDKRGGSFVKQDSEAEVWLAPAVPGFLAPVKIQIESRVGRLVLQARSFEVE